MPATDASSAHRAVVLPVRFSPGAGISISPPSHGTLSMEEGDVLYVPHEGYCGADRFTYRVTDAAGRRPATATVDVVVKCDDEEASPAMAEEDRGSPEAVPSAPPADARPILNDDAARTDRNAEVLIPVLDNDEFVPPGEWVRRALAWIPDVGRGILLATACVWRTLTGTCCLRCNLSLIATYALQTILLSTKVLWAP